MIRNPIQLLSHLLMMNHCFHHILLSLILQGYFLPGEIFSFSWWRFLVLQDLHLHSPSLLIHLHHPLEVKLKIEPKQRHNSKVMWGKPDTKFTCLTCLTEYHEVTQSATLLSTSTSDKIELQLVKNTDPLHYYSIIIHAQRDIWDIVSHFEGHFQSRRTFLQNFTKWAKGPTKNLGLQIFEHLKITTNRVSLW